MTVPIEYYLRFYFSNTLLGLAFAGFLCIFPSAELVMIMAPYSYYLILSIFLIHQIYIIRAFIGNRRGEFEYIYLEKKTFKYANSFLRKTYGLIKFFFLWLDEFGEFSYFRDSIYKEVLNNHQLMNDSEFKLSFCLKLAKIYGKEGIISNEKHYIESALAINPSHTVALFMFATFCERQGDAKTAITNYREILTQSFGDSFKKFISDQIKRVNEKGPSRRHPIKGIRWAPF